MVRDSYRLRAARATAPATGIILALVASLAPVPVSADGHNPWSPVQGALTALQEGRFEDIATYFCEEQQPAVLALDFQNALMSDIPADSSPEDMEGALGWTAELSSATPVDATFPPPPETTLMVSGSVSRTLDPELAFELFEEFIVEGDAGSAIDSISANLDSSGIEFSEELEVVRPETDPGGAYLICSEFVALSTLAGSGSAAVAEEDASEPVDEDG